jgi:hypothetical protein
VYHHGTYLKYIQVSLTSFYFLTWLLEDLKISMWLTSIVSIGTNNNKKTFLAKRYFFLKGYQYSQDLGSFDQGWQIER